MLHEDPMRALEPFLGAWTLQADFPGARPEDTRGRTTFEWLLGGRFLCQRSEIAHPAAPDAFSVIRADPETGAFLQHYDSRGVVRIYAMTFDGSVWTLRRETPDFTPVAFAQRFTGTFAHDGRTIDGAWETRRADARWELDFRLVYTRS